MVPEGQRSVAERLPAEWNRRVRAGASSGHPSRYRKTKRGSEFCDTHHNHYSFHIHFVSSTSFNFPAISNAHYPRILREPLETKGRVIGKSIIIFRWRSIAPARSKCECWHTIDQCFCFCFSRQSFGRPCGSRCQSPRCGSECSTNGANLSD